jgi:hypothetical protein
MVRAKLDNVGDDAENEVDISTGEHEVTQTSNTIEADTEQDIADQQAAGVRPQRGNNNPPATPSIKAQYNALKRVVIGLGAQHGAGKTSMIALAEAVTEAAQDGVVTPEQTGEIYDKFREGVKAKSEYEDAGEVPDEATMERLPTEDADKSREQQLSKLKRFILLGNKYQNDALDLMRRARNVHLDLLRQGNRKSIKPGSTYTVMVDIARAQLGRQDDAVKKAKAAGQKFQGLADVLTDNELNGLMTQEVKDKEALTGADKILNAIKEAKAARNGGADRNPVPSQELDNAIDWLIAALHATDPALLADYNKKLDDAEQAKIDAETRKAETAAAKAEKALLPKEPKQTKAERQAALTTSAA